jgi:hypothetical protein
VVLDHDGDGTVDTRCTVTAIPSLVPRRLRDDRSHAVIALVVGASDHALTIGT